MKSGERCGECHPMERLPIPPVPPLGPPAPYRQPSGTPGRPQAVTPRHGDRPGVNNKDEPLRLAGSGIMVPCCGVLTVRVSIVLDEADGAVGGQLQEAVGVLAVQLVTKFVVVTEIPSDVGRRAAGLPGHHAGVRRRDPGGVRGPSHQGRQHLPVQRWRCCLARRRRGAVRPGDPGCLAFQVMPVPRRVM
ncbi:hypothetical protein E2C01_058759 [Portunus trituberculatus]|uniref:Uncharacterized protein n=1 Tax=Portunus trituberculatus TaxID=210409 RepID=A0A5B7H0Q0_PORTR|nr:hypothetical protein [Portunus trituberculatus]